jgi:hypothetical protein
VRRTGRAGDTDRHRVYGIKMGMGVTYGAKRNRLEVRRLLIMSYQGIIHEYRKQEEHVQPRILHFGSYSCLLTYMHSTQTQ